MSVSLSPLRSYSFSTLKHYAKISDVTPEKMHPTTKSVILQISVSICGFSTAVAHGLARDNILILYSISALCMISAALASYYEVDSKALKLFILSFRGGIITFCTLLAIICNLGRKLFFPKETNEPLLTLIIDDITFWIGIVMLISADCAPRVVNFIRLFGPLFIIANVIWIIVDMVLQPSVNYTFFKYMNGAVKLNDIELGCYIQIFWFGFPYLYAVINDKKHRYFVLIDNKVALKSLLPLRNKITDGGGKISSKLLFISLAGIASLFAIIFIISDMGIVGNNSHIKISLLITNIILALILLILTIILIYQHFQWYMIQELMLQFRCNMLMITIVITVYCAIQKSIWFDPNIDNDITTFIISMLLNHLVFALAVIICLFRDGMNISYPNWFVIFSAICVFLISSWNIVLLTFVEIGIYPTWFELLEKQAYYSVMVICFLSLYYVWKDPENKYAILIRKRKKTASIWGNQQQIEAEDPDIISTYDVSSSSPQNETNGIIMNQSLLTGQSYDINEQL